MTGIPKSAELIRPLLRALQSGEVLSNNQIREKIAKEIGITEDELRLIHSGTRTEFEYRLAWARTMAKSKGWLESPKRMHWRLTELGKTKI
jgi:restriction system protein